MKGSLVRNWTTWPGDSVGYVNPDNPNDHTVSVGDWVLGRPEVSHSPDVESAFAGFAGSYFIVAVPVWDRSSGQGDTLRYHVSDFAWMYGLTVTAWPNPIASPCATGAG